MSFVTNPNRTIFEIFIIFTSNYNNMEILPGFLSVWNRNISKRFLCSVASVTRINKSDVPSERSHKLRINRFIKSNAPINELKHKIPKKYLKLKSKSLSDHLYLIDPDAAKDIAKHITSNVKNIKNQVICETNAGLGLISTELLENNVKQVRLYESCIEFREHLKEFSTLYPGRVELFNKDIFNLHRYAYMDKMDDGDRVEQMLQGVPKKSWSDDPFITIVGPLSKKLFIKYLIRSLVLQHGIITYGRVRLLTLIRPKDFAIFTATPEQNLHTYQSLSVLFNLLFDIKLLEKYPRNIFLPWESTKITPHTRFPNRCDPDCMYLVQIDFKKELPVSSEKLLSLYFFVQRLFGRGSNKVIPTLEKWIPGCGADIIGCTEKHTRIAKDEMNIFIEFGELTPPEILSVFEISVNYPSYKTSPFLAMIETQIEKSETVETSVHEAVMEKNIAGSTQIKLQKNK